MDIHQPDALAVANYMLELAKEEGKELQPLKLMKLVYIAHGFMLALLGRSALNPRFDRVEAWQYVLSSLLFTIHLNHTAVTE